ncbi:MAG: hypothetical protein HZA35_00490 [Parcubacteria group bacterium]|nr:hypothetical protein [Parcubacteria group bacterium]
MQNYNSNIKSNSTCHSWPSFCHSREGGNPESTFPGSPIKPGMTAMLVVFLLVGFFVQTTTPSVFAGISAVGQGEEVLTQQQQDDLARTDMARQDAELRAAGETPDTAPRSTAAGDGPNIDKANTAKVGLKVNCGKSDSWFAWFFSWISDPLACELPGFIAIVFINAELVVLNVIAAFMQWVIQYPILDLSAVIVAWQFLRDLVNLCFVLAMILMAFATMLNVTQYTYRKLFLDVILGALLINFSLVFIGFFLDMNAISSSFMLNQMSTEQNLAGLILNTSNITSIAEKDTNGVPLLTLMAMPGFILFIIIVFLVILIPMIARIVYLIQYTVLSPLIWLHLIFKKADWQKWWKEFLTWCFMPTVSLFFIYLAFAIYGPMYSSIFKPGAGITSPLVNFTITAILLGTLLMSAVAAAWKGLDKLASFVLDIAMAVATGGAGAIAKSGLGMAAKGMGGKLMQEGAKRGGFIGGKLMKAGKGIQTGVGKLDDTDERLKVADSTTIGEMRKNYQKKQNPNTHDLDTMHKLDVKHAENLVKEGKKFEPEETEAIYRAASAEKDKDKKKENMEWFVKHAGQFDENALKKSMQPKGAIAGDVVTKGKLADHFNKEGRLDEKTLASVDLGNREVRTQLQNESPDTFKALVTSHPDYHESVLAATTSEEKQQAMKVVVDGMSPTALASLNMEHLTTGNGSRERLAAIRESSRGAAILSNASSRQGGSQYAERILTDIHSSKDGFAQLKKVNSQFYQDIVANKHMYAKMAGDNESLKTDLLALRTEKDEQRAEQMATSERRHQETIKTQQDLAQAQRDLAEAQKAKNTAPVPQGWQQTSGGIVIPRNSRK